MGGSQTTTQTEQSERRPWAEAAQFFPDLYSRGQQAMQSNQGTPLPQQFVAGAAPSQMQALQMMYQLAPQMGGAAPGLQEMAKRVASGFFLDPSNDPTFQGAVNAAINPLTQQLQNTILPNIIGQSIQAGGAGTGPSAFGGAGLDFNRRAALDAWGRAAGDVSAGMANQSRMMGMQLIPQAAEIAEGANRISLAPSTTMGLAGTQEQAFNQLGINDQLQRYQAEIQHPWRGLQDFANLLTTGGFGQTDTTRTTTGPAPDLGTQILQGLTGGLGLLGGLFGTPFPGGQSLFSNIFTGLGGLWR